jgi:hypothetical protein
MAAGLGFKNFNTGDVLSAADTNGYLMQGVWVFADAAARDAAVTSPQEGNFAYLKDTNVTTYYTGSAWANLDTTGMTNPMTTTGDTIYSSSGSTPARLGIGTTGQVLTVAGGVPSWAAPAGGGDFVLVKTVTIGSGVSSVVVTDAFSATYKKYKIIFNGGASSATSDGWIQFGSTNTGYYSNFIYSGYGGTTITSARASNNVNTATVVAFSANGINGEMIVYSPFESRRTGYQFQSSTMATTGNRWTGGGYQDSDTSFTDFTLLTQGAVTLTGGTISVYGIKE